MLKKVNLPLRILITVVLFAVGFFAVTFTVYMLNLDMKLTAAIEPFMQKHYDKIERERYL